MCSRRACRVNSAAGPVSGCAARALPVLARGRTSCAALLPPPTTRTLALPPNPSWHVALPQEHDQVDLPAAAAGARAGLQPELPQGAFLAGTRHLKLVFGERAQIGRGTRGCCAGGSCLEARVICSGDLSGTWAESHAEPTRPATTSTHPMPLPVPRCGSTYALRGLPCCPRCRPPSRATCTCSSTAPRPAAPGWSACRCRRARRPRCAGALCPWPAVQSCAMECMQPHTCTCSVTSKERSTTCLFIVCWRPKVDASNVPTIFVHPRHARSRLRPTPRLLVPPCPHHNSWLTSRWTPLMCPPTTSCPSSPSAPPSPRDSSSS